MKALKLILIVVLIIFALIFIISYISAIIIREHNIKDYAISEVREYDLAGYKQKVLIEGASLDNPILLVLHGGPGTPIPFNVGASGVFKELTDNYIAVYWDQYGSGANNAVVDSRMNPETYVDMSVDLVKTLKTEFPENDIELFGYSWGSFLACRVANELPELITRVTTAGQITHGLFANEEVFNALDKAPLSNEEKEQLNTIKNKGSYEGSDIDFIASLLQKYTEGYMAKGNKLSLEGVSKGGFYFFALITSPNYSLQDIKAMIKNGFYGNDEFSSYLPKMDLRDELDKIQVPYRIFQGDKDLVTSTILLQAYLAQSENENIKLIILKNSSHYPSPHVLNHIEDFIGKE